jgi:hypothetical protein
MKTAEVPTSKSIRKRIRNISRAWRQRAWRWRYGYLDDRLTATDRKREIKSKNRTSLATVNSWITDSDYERSIYRYGIRPKNRLRIDAPIGEETTLSDLIACLAMDLTKDIRYLEIGVSVGKNFFQMLNQWNDALLVGFDIEDINPVLERYLEKGASVSWETKEGSPRKSPSSLTEYTFKMNRNQVRYLTGDLFDDASWARLAGSTFNLVFSDACHEPKAILREWDLIKSLRLLDQDEFVFVWDDLRGEMQGAFKQISAEMRRTFNIPASDVWLGLCRGWYGSNQNYHEVGVLRKLGSAKISN